MVKIVAIYYFMFGDKFYKKIKIEKKYYNYFIT